MRRVSQGLWIAAGGALALWTLLDPNLRDLDGFPEPRLCLGLSCAFAALGIGAAWGGRLRPAALWSAVVIVGQAVLLQLIDAGRAIHYEHWSPPYAGVSAWEGALLGTLALQALAVAVALARRRRALGAWLHDELGWGRAALVAAVFVGTSAFPSRELGGFALEVVLSSCVRAVQLGAVVLAAAALPPDVRGALQTRFEALLDGAAPGARSRWIPLACALWVFAVAWGLAVYSYDRHPHIPDEVAYLWQARYLAEGLLYTPSPTVVEAFDVYLVDCDGVRCHSPFPPGWPALLAVGTRLGAPWATNPLLAALNVLLAFWLVRELYDRRTARLAALLLAVSPWHLFMAMNVMSHTSSLTLALGAACSVARLRRDSDLRWAVLGGIGIGGVSLVRPLEGLMVAGVLGLAALGMRGRRFRLAPVLTLGLTSALVGATVLPYNEALTGSPTTFPVMEYMEKVWGPGTNSLGFGPEKSITWNGLDPFPGHGLGDVIVNAELNGVGLNLELLGWSTGSLLPVLLLLVSGRVRRSDLWLLFAIATVVAVQSLYWFSGGPDFGARYWYLVIVPLIALAARGILELGDRGAGRPGSLGAVGFAVSLLCVAALVNYVPWRAIDKYHHYRGMRPDLRELLAEQSFGRALLLVRGESHPDMASAIVYNPLDPAAAEPLFAWDRSPEVRARLLREHADRVVWVVEGPSRTGRGFRVVAGPLDPAAAERALATPPLRTDGADPE